MYREMLMNISHSQEGQHLVLKMITNYITSKRLIGNISGLQCVVQFNRRKTVHKSNLLSSHIL